MSKGSLFWGTASGKLGETVFYRSKGEQRNRAYVRNVSNPRTPLQIAQRMKLYAPISVYRAFSRAFFKFAFDDIKQRETLFNAFMRHNIVRAPWVEKSLASAYAPVPMPAVLSVGSVSLPDNIASGEFQLSAEVEGTRWGTLLTNPKANNAGFDIGTVGELSSILINDYGFQAGDKLTFVTLSADSLSIEDGNIVYDGNPGFNFSFNDRLVLDVNSTVQIDQLGLSLVPSTFPGGAPNIGLLSTIPTVEGRTVAASCLIITRKAGEEIISSTSVLQLNAFATEVYNLMSTDAYRDKAALTYNVSEPAILNPSNV